MSDGCGLLEVARERVGDLRRELSAGHTTGGADDSKSEYESSQSTDVADLK